MSAPIAIAPPARPTTGRLLHILSTSSLTGNDVLVTFADGSSAIYEMDELEKLRPTPKQIFPATAAKHQPFAEVA